MNSVVKQRIADIQRGNVPAGYRKTKCGIIPDTWSCCQPKEIFSGKSIKNNDSELPVLSVTQENGVMLRSEMDKDISYKEDSVSSYKRVDIGDFVISLRSFEGGIEYSQCQGVVSPAYTIFSHSEDVDGSFYKYYFKTDFFINKLNTAVYGIRDGKQIGFQDFSNLFIHCPPLEEQRRIAEILVCCDRVIALKKELIAEKKKQKKALMQKLLNPDSGFRLPGFSGKWKKFRISEICKIESGGTPATADEQCWNGDIFWCTPSDITNAGKYISHTPQKITPKGLDTSSATLLPTGSVIMCSRASIGPRCITQVPMATNQGFKNFICSDLLYNEFWYYFIDTILEDLYKMASGNTFKEVSKNSIATYLVTIPSNIAEQQAIADILSAADKEIDLLEQELVQQEQKKKSLMQLLLTGIVRVQNI